MAGSWIVRRNSLHALIEPEPRNKTTQSTGTPHHSLHSEMVEMVEALDTKQFERRTGRWGNGQEYIDGPTLRVGLG